MVRLVTNLGDAALLLPASAVLFAYLIFSKSLRAAIAWAAMLMLCVGLTIVAKVLFHACGSQITSLGIHSPSGHVALSTMFYGSAALIFSAGRNRPRRWLMLLGCAALVCAIAVSRLVIHAHTPAEVAVGFLIGGFCLALYAAGPLHRLAPPPAWQIPAGILVALALFMHGHHLSAESVLDRLTDRVQLSQHLCPVNGNGLERTVARDAALGS